MTYVKLGCFITIPKFSTSIDKKTETTEDILPVILTFDLSNSPKQEIHEHPNAFYDFLHAFNPPPKVMNVENIPLTGEKKVMIESFY